MTIHLVYAKGVRTGAPHAITNELAARLRASADVRVYDLAEVRTIVPQSGDVLIGHPHHDPRTVFASSVSHPGWARRIVMCPFSHAQVELNGWMDGLVDRADTFLAITGKYWLETMATSAFSHWQYKTRRLDLAVNPEHFPPIKTRWNPPGRRKFLYIGYTAPAKGTDYLVSLAEALPWLNVGWIGGGFMPTGRIDVLGPCDFNLPEARRLVAGYDFILATGRSDANPTTLLEGLAWGLVPVCTPQSGYRGEPWVINIPLDDVDRAAAILQRLNDAPEEELAATVARGRAELRSHYTWDRFAADVRSALREPPAVRPSGADWDARAAANRERLRGSAGVGGGKA
jgi:glycosyltransferase involved in cell wall biosynthesis